MLHDTHWTLSHEQLEHKLYAALHSEVCKQAQSQLMSAQHRPG